MSSYSVDQIIGKTLYAKKSTPVYNLPSFYSLAKQVYTIKPGQPIGTVYSYVGGSPGQPLNWMFKTNVGLREVTYYTVHEQDNVDRGALTDQGAKTQAEIQREKQEAAKGTGEKIFDFVKKYAIIAGLAYGAFLIFKNYKSSNK